MLSGLTPVCTVRFFSGSQSDIGSITQVTKKIKQELVFLYRALSDITEISCILNGVVLIMSRVVNSLSCC